MDDDRAAKLRASATFYRAVETLRKQLEAGRILHHAVLVYAFEDTNDGVSAVTGCPEHAVHGLAYAQLRLIEEMLKKSHEE